VQSTTSGRVTRWSVHSMDRLARNLEDLRRTIRELTRQGVRVEFVYGTGLLPPTRTVGNPPTRL
jgi:DNA invertase Pin-like site-specific DNA recombinase